MCIESTGFTTRKNHCTVPPPTYSTSHTPSRTFIRDMYKIDASVNEEKQELKKRMKSETFLKTLKKLANMQKNENNICVSH